MRELDKNKVYDLSELTSEQWNILIPILKKQSYYGYNYQNLYYYKEDNNNITLYFNKDECWVVTSLEKPTTNAKELFYTLENVQVDLRELTSKEIQEMYFIVENNNYNTKKDLYRCKDWFYFSYNKKRFCFSENRRIDNDKTTITYEKFMDLFGYKEKSEEFNNLVEVLNEELTEEAYKETEYEVKYIAEKPKQYQIGIDTFQRCEANMTKEEILACVRFNIDKYNFRVKGQDLEDLEKIIAYANWGIKQLKK